MAELEQIIIFALGHCLLSKDLKELNKQEFRLVNEVNNTILLEVKWGQQGPHTLTFELDLQSQWECNLSHSEEWESEDLLPRGWQLGGIAALRSRNTIFSFYCPPYWPLPFQSGLVPFITHLWKVWSFFLEVSHAECGSGYWMASLKMLRKLPFSICLTSYYFMRYLRARGINRLPSSVWLTSYYFMMYLRAREINFSPK